MEETLSQTEEKSFFIISRNTQLTDNLLFGSSQLRGGQLDVTYLT